MKGSSSFALLSSLNILFSLSIVSVFAQEQLVIGNFTESTSGGFKFPDGTVQTTANVFPAVLTGSSLTPLLDFTNIGLGNVGTFIINSPANSSSAIVGITNGSGGAVKGISSGSGSAIVGKTTGTGLAGYFSITNPSNSSPVLHAETNGTGPTGSFSNTNATNPSSTLWASTNGTAPAIGGRTTGTGNAGYFNTVNPTNSNAALFVQTEGLGPAVLGIANGSGPSFAGLFKITNANNSYSALQANTIGTGAAVSGNSYGSGPAIVGMTTGTGLAGYFSITNPSNSSPVLHAETNGTGPTGSFSNTNATNPKSTLWASTNGTAPAIGGRTTGTGNAGYFNTVNPTNSNAALFVQTEGLGPAVLGIANGSGPSIAGLFRITNAANTYPAIQAETVGTGPAGRFFGDVDIIGNTTISKNLQVSGTLSKSSGTFKIDHPLDPRNKYLYHSFVESPDMKNIYDGVVVTDSAGYATVELPAWFEALNKNFRYQLTVIDETDNANFVQAKIVRGVTGGHFTLRSSAPDTMVSWQVTGIRQDAYAEQNRIVVEEEKTDVEKGTCLYPGACAGK